MRVRVVAPGPDGHGVVRHARDVVRLVAAHGIGAGAPADLTHAQFTDGIWGADVASAADAFTAASRELPRPLVVTLHDLPGADPDPARDARRIEGYRRVTRIADAVVVSSEHEADRVRGFDAGEPVVVPLPLPEPAPPGPVPAWADRPTIGVLGFVYPGKGHAEAVDAVARHPSRPRVVAAGAVSPGHDPLWTDLRRRAARRGVDLHLTGSLTEPELAAAAAAVTVPLAPNRLVSASGSLLSWIAHGRVPLAADGPYAREVENTAPGSVLLYDDDGSHRTTDHHTGHTPGSDDPAGGRPVGRHTGRQAASDHADDLDTAVRAALADPARTRRRTTVDWPDAGVAHAALYARVLDGVRC